MSDFNQELEIFLKMKNDYPKLLKDSIFEQELKDAIKSLDNQLEEYYIDMRDGNCDELDFGILRIAFKQYKDSHNIK